MAQQYSGGALEVGGSALVEKQLNPSCLRAPERVQVMAHINDLSAPLISHILSFLGPKDCCRLSSTQKSWVNTGGEDPLWQTFCLDDFGVTRKLGIHGQAFQTFKETYGHWHAEMGKYGSTAKRAIMAWRTIEDWCSQHLPGILATLRPGTSEAALDSVELALGRALPASLRAVYRIHDGQAYDVHTPPLHGLFGWFSVYSDMHSTFMYPLEQVARACFPWKQEHLLFFATSVVASHHIAIDSLWVDPRIRSICTELRTGRVRMVSRTRMADAAPLGAVRAEEDGFMCWFEAWASALRRGYYQPMDLDGPAGSMMHHEVHSEMQRRGTPLRGISLIPRLAPGQVEATTKGVRVRASVIFQMDGPATARSGYLFAYSIQMALLSVEEQLALAGNGPCTPLTSAQLRSRHWVIRHGTSATADVVEGDGVIGEYPLLTAGGPPFEYQSCTQQRDLLGSMEGAFTFVEGSIASPTGPAFHVQCPKFFLKFQDYHF